jgi:superfamily II DNA or RNA helicase
MAPLSGSFRIDQYLRQNADAKVVSRGKAIFTAGRYTFKSMDRVPPGEARFSVQSEATNQRYTVVLTGITGTTPGGSCTCPYDMGDVCKHQVAAWLAVAPMLIGGIPAAPVLLPMDNALVSLPDLTDDTLRRNTPPDLWKARNNISKTTLISTGQQTAEITITHKKEDYHVRISRSAPGQYHTACSCGASLAQPLCGHKLAALLRLRGEFGPRAFDQFDRDWTAEKNKLLADYGFSMADDLSRKFDFKTDPIGNDLRLIILDPSIQKINRNWAALTHRWTADAPANTTGSDASDPVELPTEPLLLFAIDMLGPDQLPDLKLTPLLARRNRKTGKITHVRTLDRQGYGNAGIDELPVIGLPERDLIQLGKRFTAAKLVEQLQKEKTLPASYYGYMSILPDDARPAAARWVNRQLDAIFDRLTDQLVFLSESVYQYSSTSITPVTVSARRLRPRFSLREAGEFILLEASVLLEDGQPVPYERLQAVGQSAWVRLHQGTLYKWAGPSDAEMSRVLDKSGQMRVRKQYIERFFNEFVIPLAGQFEVDIAIDKEIGEQPLTLTERRVYIQEDGEDLLFRPAFAYTAPDTDTGPAETLEFGLDGRNTKLVFAHGRMIRFRRDTPAETALVQTLSGLHPAFGGQTDRPAFRLAAADVLRDGWFFDFTDALREAQITLLGVKSLSRFRVNPNRGAVQVRASSGIDWFDLQVEIQFGDQFASLADVRRAVVNRQEYIPLADGTLGLLPADWLARHAQLFKTGRIEDGTLKVSKRHFALMESLAEQANNPALLLELAEKKQKLLNFRQIKSVPLPAGMLATLRDYQVEGYKWLHFLDEFGWGGCLADDMGLGKTLQMLTFLQAQKEAHPGAVSLVVVPTSLVFNWLAEVRKFCPGLRVLDYKQDGRLIDTADFSRYDLVLATYGMMRADIERLRGFRFHYVILDESQAIKNPNSVGAKAARLLQATNRLAMTGTPVENNTFDLYSQMEFLNPGLLGSMESFRSDYATPIDKHQDAERAADLRRLLTPFLLKRTKEEVAKDLPDKTETILYCEMGKKQRKVYDAVREHYRQRIVDEMASVGREQAAFLILEGLLKLRQVCDSPALLSGGTNLPPGDYGPDSAKLDELTREIEENASGHKILIFSQFLKMLDMIRQNLEKLGIAYEYLDGSVQDRAGRVDRFQTDTKCRVFLVSLKAGGVGLNLTEADYVYLVDPWWNPAVEQQAIDRAHRIGQTRSVFAYRMICKDSVEEKIMELQDRKRALATDLIGTEAGFIKKLTRDDIVGLFS